MCVVLTCFAGSINLYYLGGCIANWGNARIFGSIRQSVVIALSARAIDLRKLSLITCINAGLLCRNLSYTGQTLAITIMYLR